MYIFVHGLVCLDAMFEWEFLCAFLCECDFTFCRWRTVRSAFEGKACLGVWTCLCVCVCVFICVRICVYICVWKPNLTAIETINLFDVQLSISGITIKVFYVAYIRKTIFTLSWFQQKLYWETKTIYVQLLVILFRKILMRKLRPFGLGWTWPQCRTLTNTKICDITVTRKKGN